MKFNINVVPLEDIQCFIVQRPAVSSNNMTDARIFEVGVTLVAITFMILNKVWQ